MVLQLDLHLDLHADLQVTLQVLWFYNKIYRTWDRGPRSVTSNFHSNSSGDRTETITSTQNTGLSQKYRSEIHYTFWQSCVWCLRNRGCFEQLLHMSCDIWEQRMFQETDMSNFLMIQIFRWNRSSVRLATNSMCKSTFGFTHRSTSRAARQSTRSTGSTRNLQADLQVVQHWWVQTIHKMFSNPVPIWFIYSQENAMAHLAGIDKGPVLHWTDDNSLLEWFRKWKKKLEILFWGPLSTANDTVKCNYIIYWSGETGMELVDKWEMKDKINNGNRNQIARYFELFEEHISPKLNALIAIVELKRLFQETLSLEDFHTKVLRLVKEAEYPEGAIRNRVLQDTIISGLASDKIRAKVIKEGKDVTLTRAMEIAHLEVSAQKHIDWMQETVKVNYVQYRKGAKGKKHKPRTSGSGGSSANTEECSGNNTSAGEAKSKGKKPPLPKDICWRCGKARHKKGQICKALESICRNCRIKGHYEKVCIKKSAHLVNVPEDSNDSEPLYYDELGEPVYVQTYAVQVNTRNRINIWSNFLWVSTWRKWGSWQKSVLLFC